MLKPPSHFLLQGLGITQQNTSLYLASTRDDVLALWTTNTQAMILTEVVVRDIEFLSAHKTPQLVVISIFNPTAAHIVASKIFALGHRPIFLEEFVILTGAERTLINFPELEDVDKFLEVDHFFDDQLSKLTVNAIKYFGKQATEPAYME